MSRQNRKPAAPHLQHEPMGAVRPLSTVQIAEADAIGRAIARSFLAELKNDPEFWQLLGNTLWQAFDPAQEFNAPTSSTGTASSGKPVTRDGPEHLSSAADEWMRRQPQ